MGAVITAGRVIDPSKGPDVLADVSVRAGFPPGTISTDLNVSNIGHPVGSLTDTMSKLGPSASACARASGSRPRRPRRRSRRERRGPGAPGPDDLLARDARSPDGAFNERV